MPGLLAISSQLTYVRVRGLIGYFHEAAVEHNVPMSLLLAIASRESNMGLNLDSNWTGDNGNGIGVMQIDRRYHPEFTGRYANNDHRANIYYGAEFLAQLMRLFHGNLTAAVAAYNAGASRVRTAISSGLSPDLVTTGKDYASDVLRRKQIIESLLGATKASSFSVVMLPVALAGFASYKLLTHKT
jgi:soluble lytic murein transglycosylase-like protein